MKILVATDGSRGSAAALKFALRLESRDREGELVVLTVAVPDGGSTASRDNEPDAEHEPRAVAQRILKRSARHMGERGATARFYVATARNRDDVPEVISREADKIKADLVVIGSEGRDTLCEWALGGTALRLIYVARRPVTVVRTPVRRKAN